MRPGRLAVVLVTLLLLLCLAPLALAQKVSGTITGTVTDPTGAVVPGAAVTLTNQATGATRTATTNAEGAYTIPEVGAGTYNVTVNKGGFKQVTQKGVEVHVSDVTTLNVALTMGAASEQVTVEASPVQVETQTGVVGNVMLGEQVRELPLNGRSFVQLTMLVPGAAAAEGFDAKNKGLLAGVDISFSGAPSNANQWRVDGANNNDIGSQRTVLIYPSIDSIEEFKILRNSYGPEYGGAGGAQINVVTKGGGNDFHGSAYYFGRNDALNAKNYFLGLTPAADCAATPVTCKKQKLRRNDYGYTYGGPIKRDKVFFFWSEEWNVERRGAVRHRFVPTAAERNGDFRDLAGCPSRMPVDPATGAPFVFNGQTNVINPNRLSPAGQAYVSQIALPNISNPCATNNWVQAVGIPIDWREENVRGDINLTKSHTLMLRFTNDKWANPTHGYDEGGLWGDSDYPALSSSWNQPGKMAVATLTSTLGSSTVNSFQFSWSANRINITTAGDDPSLNTAIRSKIPTLFPASNKLQASSLAEPFCWCGGLASGNLGISGPFNNRQDLYTWKDDFSKVMGKHTFKGGVIYSQNAKDEIPQGSESGNMWGATGYQSNWTALSGNWYSDLLLKGTLFGGGEAARDEAAQIRWRDLEFYGGDSFKVSRRLNLEYGIRWTLQRPEYLEDNKFASWVPSLYKASAGGDPCNGIMLAKGAPNDCAKIGSTLTPAVAGNRSIVPYNNHLIAPRLGFAWDVTGKQKFVLRGGIGQFFSRDPVGLTLRMHSNNAPYAVAVAPERTLDGPLVFSGPNQNVFDFGSPSGAPHQGKENNTNIANTWQWNLTNEVALWKDTKLELGWVALRGIHLNSSHQANQVAPKDRLNYILRGLAGQDAGARADLLPFGALTTGGLIIWDHRGDSIYHSLQAMFSTKFSRNSIFQSAYTWSRNISTTTLSYVDTSTGVSDSYNSRANRGLADFDRRHLFNATLVYNLPSAEKWGAFANKALGNWEVGTIVNIASGPALTIGGGVDVIGNPWGEGNSNTGGLGSVRPNRVLSQPCTVSGSSNRLQYLNPKAFTWDGFKLGGYPNAGPGQCAGPGTADLDLSFDKNWTLPFHGGKYFGEKARLQFRLEAFNALNHPMFRFGGNNLGYNVTGAQFTAANTIDCSKCTLGTSPFGQVQLPNGIGNREIQYALKLIF